METVVSITVRYRDLDTQGHVNYASYLTYLEEAANSLWALVLEKAGRRLTTSDLGYVSARAEIDYIKPASYGSVLEVSVALSAVGERSFTTMYRIVDKESRQLVATAKTVQVITLIDPATGAPLLEIRAALSELLPSGE